MLRPVDLLEGTTVVTEDRRHGVLLWVWFRVGALLVPEQAIVEFEHHNDGTPKIEVLPVASLSPVYTYHRKKRHEQHE